MNPTKPDTTDSPEWLISYSDLMSLFLCFFIMLFALSTMQEERIEAATESLRGGFGLFGTNMPFYSGTAARPTGAGIGGTITFDWGSDDLPASATQELNELYRQLLSTTNNVQIVGQARLGEPSAYRRELDLAYSRAINVWDYLVSLGMDRERLEIVQQVDHVGGAAVQIRSGR
jgi:flagellar motor protein MotB